VSIVLEWINNHFSDFETDANLSEFLEQLEALMEKQVFRSDYEIQSLFE